METQEAGLRRGWLVFAVLAVLTAVEFVISSAMDNPLPLLAIVALAKAGLIIWYFMHLGDMKVLWREEANE